MGKILINYEWQEVAQANRIPNMADRLLSLFCLLKLRYIAQADNCSSIPINTMNVNLARGYFPGLFVLAALLSFSCTPPAPTTLRIATYNIEDIRVQDLKNPDQSRLKAAAAVLQELQADILLINEITYDQPGTPGFEAGDEEGSNATRFARTAALAVWKLSVSASRSFTTPERSSTEADLPMRPLAISRDLP